MSIACRKCGSINDYALRPNDVHGAGAWCKSCGSWIKWMGKPLPETVSEVSLDEQIQEIQAEIAIRQRVYPRWIAEGRITREKAQKKILRMQAAQASLEKNREQEQHGYKLFG